MRCSLARSFARSLAHGKVPTYVRTNLVRGFGITFTPHRATRSGLGLPSVGGFGLDTTTARRRCLLRRKTFLTGLSRKPTMIPVRDAGSGANTRTYHLYLLGIALTLRALAKRSRGMP